MNFEEIFQVNKRQHKQQFLGILGSPILAWSLGFLVWSLTYLRIFFGIDVTDEAYYVACALLTAIGGKPYTNDMYFQQNASLLYEPLVFLYNRLVGTSGVVLFVRHLFFFLATGCGLSYYYLFCKRIRREQAALISVLPICFVPYMIPSLGYNTLGSLLFASGLALLANGVISRKVRLQFWAAILFALSGFAYPSFGIGAFFILTGLTAISFFRKDERFKSLVFTGLLCGGLFVGLWTTTLARFGYQNLLDSLELTRQFGALGSLQAKLQMGLEIFRSYTPPLWTVALLLLLSVGSLLIFSLNWLWLLPFLTVICLLTAPTGADSFPSHVFLTLLSLCGLPPLLLWKNKRSPDWKIAAGLFFPCLLLSGLLGWTSANTILASALATQFAVLAVVFLAASKAPKALVTVSLAFLYSTLLFWSFHFVYRDDELGKLNSLVEGGPFAGLWTTPGRKLLLLQIKNDIDQAAQLGKSVVFYDYFPAGYLFSNLRPATRSVYIHQLPYGRPARHLYTEYYQNPENRPDLVFQFESFPIYENVIASFRPEATHSADDDFFDMLPQTGDYNLMGQRRHYKIWIKKTR